MKYVDYLLSNNATEHAILKAMELVCEYLPSPNGEVCHIITNKNPFLCGVFVLISRDFTHTHTHTHTHTKHTHTH
jgi:hypothetical protein